MARVGTGSTGVYIQRSGAVVATVPLTMACWFRPVSNTDQYCLMSMSSNAGTEEFRMDSNGTGVISAIARNGGTQGAATTTTGAFSAGVWNHAAAVFNTNSSRSAFLNGANKVTETTAATPGTMNLTTLGMLNRGGSLFIPVNGRLAHCAIWDAALADDEIAALARGVNPFRIRPANIWYWPLWGNHSPEIDLSRNAASMTLTGSPAKADDAPVAPFLMNYWGSYPSDETSGPPPDPSTLVTRKALLGVGV